VIHDALISALLVALALAAFIAAGNTSDKKEAALLLAASPILALVQVMR
jgi:hypothetical protein